MSVVRYVQRLDGLASATCQFAEDQNPNVIKEVNKQMQAVLREEGSCRRGENILGMTMLAVLVLGNTPVSIEFLRDSHFERKFSRL